MLATKKQLEGLKSRVCKPVERWNDSTSARLMDCAHIISRITWCKDGVK